MLCWVDVYKHNEPFTVLCKPVWFRFRFREWYCTRADIWFLGIGPHVRRAGGAWGRARDPPRRHIRSRRIPHNGVAGRTCGMAYPPAEHGGQTCHGRPMQWACRRARPGALAPHNIDPENAAHIMRMGRSKRRPQPAARGSLPFQSGIWLGAGRRYGTPPRSRTFPMIPLPDVSEGVCTIRTGAPEEQCRCAAYAPRPHMAHTPQTDGGLQIL